MPYFGPKKGGGGPIIQPTLTFSPDPNFLNQRPQGPESRLAHDSNNRSMGHISHLNTLLHEYREEQKFGIYNVPLFRCMDYS